MTPINSDYSESALVEHPAMGIFSQLGWSVQNYFTEFDEKGQKYFKERNKSRCCSYLKA